MNQKLPEVVYTPYSQLRNPQKMLRNMWIDLLTSRELAWRLLVRNISAMYRQSILGYLWAFLPPVLTTVTFVFLKSQNIINIGETEIPYPAYVMIGTLLWQTFVNTLNSPKKIIRSSKSMLAKANFPREALILAGLGEVLFNFIIRIILMFIVFIAFQIRVPLTLFLSPLGILALMALGLMIGILLVPLGMLFQDIYRGLTIITSLWFFITPVVYPPPKVWPASLLTQVNPVSPLLITTREWLTTGTVSQPWSFIIVTFSAVLLLFIGWMIYRLAMPHLIERMSA